MPTIREFATAKSKRRQLVVVTAYDAWSARLLADSPIDALLVGDSAMMVMHGERDTLGATVELMALHTRAVARGAPDKLIVADLPFLAARKRSAYALDAAAQLMRAGAHAVKIEGVRGHADVIQHLVESGIPVMGHLGLQPQSVHAVGGYFVQGRETGEAAQLRDDAAALEAAGAFALVLECVPAPLARDVTAALRIPTIGIGAGIDCDAQVLVWQDMMGLRTGKAPRFVKRYADLHGVMLEAAKAYADEVANGAFPAAEHSFES